MTASSEKSVFLSVLELATPEERRAYLEQACAGDLRLREAVEQLLAAHHGADNVLDRIPEQVRALRPGLAPPPQPGQQSAAGSPSADPHPPVAEGPGTLIGPYKLMEQIGEGGFGHVFVAEQQQPVRRKVALKVLKPGMDTREVVARFEAERQALALMDHPHIAHVFDAGTTATGRPYFAMELVRGVAITQFCEEVEMPLRERVELFVHVCNAVQHAHQKGVIHRDLKPPNVLVTLHDGTPVVKVIDFGVAKAMYEPLTPKTIYTRFTQVIGTPLYMSPEQVEMSGLDVDTRSDIYSLGVLLYELLTGTTPIDREWLQAVSFDELRRIIREEEPPRPSARLTTLGSRGPTIPAGRRLRAAAAPMSVEGDLDWIVMKALEKDRKRRYETAAEFAADLRRYLNQEPVAARPPSPLYRFSKFARRNKAVLTTASLVLAAMVLGTGVSIWQAIGATKARAEADSLRADAVDFAERLKQANVLLDNARANADGQRWAIAYRQYTKAAELQPDHYLVWSGRAALFVRLGLWKQAAADYAKALALGAPANNPGWWGVPQVCLYAGDTKAYRVACDRTFDQIDNSSDGMLNIIALRSRLVAPHARPDLDTLVRMADGMLEAALPRAFGPESLGGGPPDFRGERPPERPPDGEPGRPGGGDFRPPGSSPPQELQAYVAGLAHYRAGQIEQAITDLREALRPGPHQAGLRLPMPALAMAYHRAGRLDEARQTLGEAAEDLEQHLDAIQQGELGSMPGLWNDFVEYLLLYREATELITGSLPAEDPRLGSIEKRALSAIGID